ncbi:hypothetical protein PACTADRAFT_36401 [Pachysolen tannophilus NRRL Y-2460]|uniref:Importin N-terminal domain-containing protein n=1 Tax=Pachysolen tannophilus NRRL Y-2460 TaxID=669874 RepID=A0A1E4U0K6_PACTA|nr:hypothetical protein PACTADRAFT_36401 [Pachysolen tannophilus NRRL Y-2460]
MSQQDIANLLDQSINSSTAKIAENGLRQLEGQPGFALNLLEVVASSSLPITTRLAGSLFFKNFIKRKFIDEDGNYKIPLGDVDLLKKNIISLMIALPNNLQVQVGEAVSIIADSDFPDRWPDLLDDLVGKLSTEDMVTNKGVLTVAHSIFKRWRPLFGSDELFSEIKLVLDKFAQPFLKLLLQVDALIDNNQQNKKQLQELFDVLLLLIKIYYDLNCQDIPEFFEDNLKIGMSIMHKYLSYSNTLLEDINDEQEIDINTKVKTSICELVQLYTRRYEDVFGDLIQQFIQPIWDLLTNIGPQPKYDILVSKSLSFLTSVAKIPKHSNIFKSPEILKEITEKVIIPSMTLREVDEELFEDDPIEYTRRDLEGSDSDTRRRAATDFLRELKNNDENLVTNTVMIYVNHYLAEFKNDNSKWRSKDIAVYFFSALASKGSVTNSGVSATNLLLDVIQFFTANIAPDLISANVHPILKVDAIKYIYSFRNQLTKQQLLEAFPLLSAHFQSNDYAVYTYTAITIEKILSLRNPEDHSKLLFSKKDISKEASFELIMNLFRLIFSRGDTPEKLAENEFLMKCIMRVLLTTEDSLDQASLDILQQLLRAVDIISKNPSNPRFSHYTFESIGALIKFNHKHQQQQYINLVFPIFGNSILLADVQEFIPYVFQILAYLLEILPDQVPLPEEYRQLIKPLLSPSIWEFKGNVPAVTRALQAIIKKSPADFNGDAGITPVLGVFQKLISSKSNDSYGFDLLEYILIYSDLNNLQKFLNQIVMILLQRLQNSRSEKYVKRFILFICLIASFGNNPNLVNENKNNLSSKFIFKFIDEVQDGLFGQILSNFIIPSSLKFNNLNDRKLIIIGLTKLITENEEFLGIYQDKFIPVLTNLIKLTTSESIKNYKEDSVMPLNDSLEDFTFNSSFNKLVTIPLKKIDPYPNIITKNELKDFFKQHLLQFSQLNNSILSNITASLGPQDQESLRELGI